MRIRLRSHAFLAAWAVAAVVTAGLAEMTVSGQASSSGSKAAPVAKTSWAAPDLQGTWSNAAVVPFERPKEYGNREFKTDAEMKAATAELLQRDELPGRDSRTAKGKDIRGTEEDVARAYNNHFFGDKPTVVARR